MGHAEEAVGKLVIAGSDGAVDLELATANRGQLVSGLSLRDKTPPREIQPPFA